MENEIQHKHSYTFFFPLELHGVELRFKGRGIHPVGGRE
jgi:hypothetical protein